MTTREPTFADVLGADVWVKHENHQPIGVFKVRGGVNLVSRLSDAERARGVICASTGNHGQSVAFAARLFGVPATVCVPEGANPVKVSSMRALGADVILYGRDFDEAREHCEHLARDRGSRYIHSGNEPLLIAGVATVTLPVLGCPKAPGGPQPDRRRGARHRHGLRAAPTYPLGPSGRLPAGQRRGASRGDMGIMGEDLTGV